MSSITGSCSPTGMSQVFAALSHPRRLRSVRILADVDASLALKDLAVELVRATRTESGETVGKDQVARVRLSLYHHHVPKLAEAGLVEFDESERRVAIAGSAPLEELAVLDG